MVTVSQGQVFTCDFGAEGGVELSGPRLAVVVSRNDYNRENSSVLVVPTTRGDIDPCILIITRSWSSWILERRVGISGSLGLIA